MGRAIVFLQAAVNIAWCRALCILKTEHLGIIGQCVLGAKPKRTGAKNYKRSPILLLLLLPSASLPVFLGGFLRHWRHVLLIHEADKRRASGLRPDSWHMNAAHICVSRRRLLLLISSQLENDLDSPGCWMCLHTLSADDIVSQKASLSAARSGALFTVTKAPIHLPSWWNSVQSHRSLLSSDCMHDGVNGYWSFWLADSQDIWMLRLLDIFIFAVNCKLPSVIRLHKGFFSPKKRDLHLSSLPHHEYSQKVKSLCSSWALYPPWLCPE